MKTLALVPVAPCQCQAFDPDCQRAGRPMTQNDWEVCSGNCPALLARNPKASDQARREWDRRTACRAAGQDPFPNHAGTLREKVATLEAELAAWQAAGKPLCDSVELALRLSACHRCEFYQAGKCKACGCSLERAPVLARAYAVATGRGDIPGKAEMRTAACPKGKWPDLSPLPVASS